MADMDFYLLATQLSDLIENNRAVFLRTEPEVPDFTARAPFKLVLCSNTQRLDLDVTPETIVPITGQLDATVFTKEAVDRLYCWNFKSFATYFHAFCPRFLSPTTNLIDLKVIENFLGIAKPRPENYADAVDRTKVVLLNKGWLKLYKQLHLPLILKVLPSIETTPLLNEGAKSVQYPYYEIEGITSGRLNSLKKFSKTYLPHNMGDDVKSALKPKGYGYRFLQSDFRHCEVTVLQWLSKDAKLGDILSSGEDAYTGIYREIIRQKCDSEKERERAKFMMLSVMYGAGPEKLGHIVGVDTDTARELIRRIRTSFAGACDWMDEVRERAKGGAIPDHFGRPRDHGDKAYKAPDIIVQGVAATVCQEKLLDLHDVLTNREKAYLAFSVHDGFGMVVHTTAARDTYKLVKATMEAESKLCPGLKMKVQIKFGGKLNAMKVLWRD